MVQEKLRFGFAGKDLDSGLDKCCVNEIGCLQRIGQFCCLSCSELHVVYHGQFKYITVIFNEAGASFVLPIIGQCEGTHPRRHLLDRIGIRWRSGFGLG